MKTNVTCSLDADLVARLDAWRAPMGVGRSTALELLLEALPEPQVESPGDQVRLYFDSNGNQVEPGTHHDNPKFDMPVAGKSIGDRIDAWSPSPLVGPLGAVGDGVTDDTAAFRAGLVGPLGSGEVAPPMGEPTVVSAPVPVIGEWLPDEVPTTPDPAAPSRPDLEHVAQNLNDPLELASRPAQ